MKVKSELNDKANNVSMFPTVLTYLFAIFVVLMLAVSVYTVHKNNVNLLPIDGEGVEQIINVD